MLLDINSQLQENPNVIPVVNFLDPKFGGAGAIASVSTTVATAPEDTPKTRSPQQSRKLSQPHSTAKASEDQDIQVFITFL